MNICMALAVNPATGARDGRRHRGDQRDALRAERQRHASCASSWPRGRCRAGRHAQARRRPEPAPRLHRADGRRRPSATSRSAIRAASSGTRRARAATSAGMGSNNVVVIDADGARAGLAPTIEVGEGPTGLALDEARRRGSTCSNKFEGSISVGRHGRRDRDRRASPSSTRRRRRSSVGPQAPLRHARELRARPGRLRLLPRRRAHGPPGLGPRRSGGRDEVDLPARTWARTSRA